MYILLWSRISVFTKAPTYDKLHTESEACMTSSAQKFVESLMRTGRQHNTPAELGERLNEEGKLRFNDGSYAMYLNGRWGYY